MAAPSTPAAIPPPLSATIPPPVPAATPPTNTPPPTAEVDPPVPSPPIVDPPPTSPPPVSPPPENPTPVPSTPPPTVPPPTPSTVPPPPDLSPPPPTLQPPPPSPSPPTITPPQPSISSPPPSTVPPPQPSLSSPPPSTVPPPQPSISSPPPPKVPPPQPSISSPPPPKVPPPQPSPSTPAEQTPPTTPPSPVDSHPSPVNSPPPLSDTPPIKAPPPKVESPSPPSDAKPPSNSPPPAPLDAPPTSTPSPSVKFSPPPSTVPIDPLPPTSPSPQSTLSPPSSDTPITPNNTEIPSNTSGFTIAANNTDRGGDIKTGAVAGIIVGVLVIVVLAALVICFMKRRKKRNKEECNGQYIMSSSIRPTESYVSQISEPATPSAPLVKTSCRSHEFPYSPQEPGLGNSKSLFTYEELLAITNGFSPQNVLGEGGFGCVYKGCLPDGRTVAVKQLKVGGGQGEREFQAEVEIIGRVHHRHLVSLVGYSISENQRLLVYDYVPNNTLHYHLHGQGRPVMEWVTRVRVAAGAARGIAYLHEDCHPRIIHRDIKSSNILLDNNFDAQVSDFGLAKLTVDAQTHVTTRVMGTFGYMAPEYATSGKLTDRSDVFSFGVVLLELVTGRKPVDASQPVGDESLVEWARPLMTRALGSGDLDGLPDPKLAGNYNEIEMLRVIETAAVCVRHSASMRPRMGLVMRVLDDLTEKKLDLQNGIIPGQSELFNSGANSADIRLLQRMAFGGPDFCSSDFSHVSWSSKQD